MSALAGQTPILTAEFAAAVQTPVHLGHAADGTPVLRAVPRIAVRVYSTWHEIPLYRPPRSYRALDSRLIGYRGNHGQPFYAGDPSRRAVALLSPPERPVAANPGPPAETMVAPRGSIPSPARVMTFLERTTRLEAEEIRATFRPGRRSAEQVERRAVVECAIVKLFERYVVARHPAAGTRQFRSARSKWPMMTPGGLKRFQDIERMLLSIYGEIEDDNFSQEGEAFNRGTMIWPHGKPDRPHKKRGRPLELLTASLCEALGVSDRTVRTVRAKASTADA